MATTRAQVTTEPMKSEAEPFDAGYEGTLKDLALDVMVKRAYPHNSLRHAKTNVEMMNISPDVKSVLLASIDRVTT